MISILILLIAKINFAFAGDIILPSAIVPTEIKIILTQVNSINYDIDDQIKMIELFKKLNLLYASLSRENQIYFSKFYFYKSLISFSPKDKNSSNSSNIKSMLRKLNKLEVKNELSRWIKFSLKRDFSLLLKNYYYQQIQKEGFKNFYPDRSKQIIINKINYLNPLYNMLVNNKYRSKNFIYKFTIYYISNLNQQIEFFLNYSEKPKELKMSYFHFPVQPKIMTKQDIIEQMTSASIKEIEELPKPVNDWKILSEDFNPTAKKQKKNDKTNFDPKDRLPNPVNDWILE